ncbi:hypothetical protein X737_38255 [Mesorhizobium sp. L48C026A00]|nr:hypothetical protein X737_38255 [Mesorhizobium sp. L48C026A00]
MFRRENLPRASLSGDEPVEVCNRVSEELVIKIRISIG